MGPFYRHSVLSLLCLALGVASVPGQIPEARRDSPLVCLGSRQFLHSDAVHSLGFTPDGKGLLSASSERLIRLWDAKTGVELRRFTGVDSAITSASLSPDGRLAAAVENGRVLRVWDTATGVIRTRILTGIATLRAVAWSPDGRSLAVGGTDRFASLFDLATGKEVCRLAGFLQGVQGLAFSPDGQVLLSSSADKVFRISDPKTGELLRRLDGHVDYHGLIAFSPDSKQVAGDCGVSLTPTATRSLVRIWDVATGKTVRDLPLGSVSALAWSPDGRFLATGTTDWMVRLWDPKTGKEVRGWTAHANRVTALSFSRDSQLLASGGADRRLRLWDVATGKSRLDDELPPGPVHSVAFAPDGRILAAGSRDRTIRFWDWAAGREARRCRGEGEDGTLEAIAYSPDGKTLASVETRAGQGLCRLWEAATAQERRIVGEGELQAAALAWLPNGTLALTHRDGSVGLWEPTTGQRIRGIGRHDGKLLALAISPDGKTLAWAGENQGAGLWDTTSGHLRKRFEGLRHHFDAALAYSPRGNFVATGSSVSSVELWDTTTGLRREVWTGSERTTALAFAPDGRSLAVGTKEGLLLWDVAASQEVRRFTGHLGEVKSVTFSPDGRLVVSGSLDGTVLVWDVTGLLQDGRLPRLTLQETELETLWHEATGADGGRAYQAMWVMVAAEATVPFLEKRFRPITGVDASRLKRLISELDDDNFEIRQQASARLLELGEGSLQALREALASATSAEVSARAELLVRRIEGQQRDRDRLTAIRGTAILEYKGTPEARRLLEAVAGGAPGALRTQEAKAARERMARREGGR